VFPSGYDGLWSGNGVQFNGRNWDIDLELNLDHALVLYPSFGCGGRWDYVAQGPQNLTAIETLSLGMDRCINGLEIRLCARDETTIIGLWYNFSTNPFAAAVLFSASSEPDAPLAQPTVDSLAAECSQSADWLDS